MQLRNRTENKTPIFNTHPVFRVCRPDDNLLSLSTLYVWDVHRVVSSRQQISCKIFKLSNHFYIVKKICNVL